MLTPSQLDGWRRYFAAEPFGARESHKLLAAIYSMLVNALSQKGARKSKLEDLLPRYRIGGGAGRLPPDSQNQDLLGMLSG